VDRWRSETTVFILFRGNIVRRLRITSGLVLFILILLYVLNYTAGILGLDAMLEVEGFRTVISRSWPGSLLLGASLLVALVGLWCFRLMKLRAVPKVAVTYVGGPVVSTPVGPTLLEISRMHNVPHAAVCGGRSRCSTCRVRVDKGLELQSPPDLAESATLGSVKAPATVRLACQLRPVGNLTITRLLHPSTTGPTAADESEADSQGIERILALMFLDIRNFTRHMEQKLPYDVVYLLNEFFAATGGAITTNGGTIDKFLGDGLLAVFGQRLGPEAGCRQALRAARAIDLALDHFNANLATELGEPIQIGIGIHAGPLLWGRIGCGKAVDVTVIGHTVNAASRLEALTKAKGCQVVISRDVAEFAGWEPASSSGESIEVRGIAKPIEIICIAQGRDLPPEILGHAWTS
jgi:adenylate cyclase